MVAFGCWILAYYGMVPRDAGFVPASNVIHVMLVSRLQERARVEHAKAGVLHA